MIRRIIENRIFIRIQIASRPLGTILYVHGLGESGYCFENLISHQRISDWNHLAPDLIGYGRSLWPERRVTLDDHVETIVRLARKKLGRPLILLGHSMGGVIGQLVCERYPELVDGFLNVEGNISIQDCTFSSRASVQELKDFTQTGFDQLKQWIFLKGIQDPVYRRYFASIMLAHPETFHHNSRELVKLSAQETLASRIKNLEMKRLYIGGLEGGIGVRSLELLRLADIDRILLDDAGHWPFWDRTDEFVEKLVRFTLEIGSV